MYFHTSPDSDLVDPFIIATYAMLAAELLGLGSCMIGSVGYFVKYSKKLMQKYGINPKNQQGIMVVFGYPEVRYQHSLKRGFANVHFY